MQYRQKRKLRLANKLFKSSTFILSFIYVKNSTILSLYCICSSFNSCCSTVLRFPCLSVLDMHLQGLFILNMESSSCDLAKANSTAKSVKEDNNQSFLFLCTCLRFPERHLTIQRYQSFTRIINRIESLGWTYRPQTLLLLYSLLNVNYHLPLLIQDRDIITIAVED